MSRFVPRLAMSAVTLAVAPAPIVVMVITAATPITMPSTVSDERNTFLRMASSASRTIDHSISVRLLALGHDPAVEEADRAAGPARQVLVVGHDHDRESLLSVQLG